MPRPQDFLIRLSDLLAGDILLFRSIDQNPSQKAISYYTKSPYTHAAIHIGNGEIAESKPMAGVQVRELTHPLRGEIIAVLRSQQVFSERRAAKLRKFVEELLREARDYDFLTALSFAYARLRGSNTKNERFVDDLIDHLKENYGKVNSAEQFAQRAYVCSALVVACYIIPGIIAENAQSAHLPDMFSPGDLYGDATFGWFLGYITPNAEDIPADDPLMTRATPWKDHPELRWWS
jgi:hypothetical protein